MRKIIFVPTLHSEGEQIGSVDVNTISQSTTDDELHSDFRKLRTLEDKTWSSIENGLSRLPKDLSNVKIFAEGVTEQELTLIEFLNDQLKSASTETQQNYARMFQEPTTDELAMLKEQGLSGKQIRLVLRLMLRGAQLEVTESENYYEGAVIMQEVGRYFIDNPDSDYVPNDLSEKFEANMQKRDEDIAQNINNKLTDSETGILIMGRRHESLLQLLDKNIQVELIDPALTEIRSELTQEFFPKEQGRSSEAKG